MADQTPEELAAKAAADAKAAEEVEKKRVADEAAAAEKAAKDEAAAVDKQAKSAKHVVLDTVHAWYDDAGKLIHYAENAIVTDYDEIRTLLKRKAPVTVVPK